MSCHTNTIAYRHTRALSDTRMPAMHDHIYHILTYHIISDRAVSNSIFYNIITPMYCHIVKYTMKKHVSFTCDSSRFSSRGRLHNMSQLTLGFNIFSSWHYICRHAFNHISHNGSLTIKWLINHSLMSRCIRPLTSYRDQQSFPNVKVMNTATNFILTLLQRNESWNLFWCIFHGSVLVRKPHDLTISISNNFLSCVTKGWHHIHQTDNQIQWVEN